MHSDQQDTERETDPTTKENSTLIFHHLNQKEKMMKSKMASSLLNKPLIIILFISLSSLSSLSSSLPSTPTISPFQELSPEIAPLLPSPGDALPSGTGAGTIPSSPSPPDPDTSDASSYPDPAFAPFASPPVSSPAPPSHPPAGVLLLLPLLSSALLRLRGVVALL
ncbi:unnamed protein product [Eruca vesicaria subsp. sativa]|uniref:Classical arabinogalactan protein 25 n=1 Tax=Eruca vesicaria subsp. sativa TaxID=29727 RepID=A0ABC8M6V5_ERUVS|nr:unnamed protein product [Eruca vesicaria subsp. sativa]